MKLKLALLKTLAQYARKAAIAIGKHKLEITKPEQQYLVEAIREYEMTKVPVLFTFMTPAGMVMQDKMYFTKGDDWKTVSAAYQSYLRSANLVHSTLQNVTVLAPNIAGVIKTQAA